MGTPIRWDTIMSRPHSESTAGITAAAGLINNGFSQMQGVVKQAEDVQTANFANQTKVNTAAYLDAVSKYQNPDDLKAAMQSGGALDQLRTSLGPNVNHDAIRGAADARIMTTMQQARDNILYKHAMTDENTAAQVQAFQTARMKGDKPGMDAAMTAYSANGGRDPTSLLKFADQRDWEINNRGMTLQTNNDQHLVSQSTIEHQRATESNAAKMLGIQAQQAATQEKQANFLIDTGTQDRQQAKAAGMAQALKTSLKENGNLYAEGMYTGNQADELRKFMKDNNVGDGNTNRQSEVINYLGEILKKGVQVKGPDGKVIDTIHDIPMSAVKQAIGGATSDFFNIGWNTAPAKNMRDQLESILGATTKNANGVLTSKALDDLKTYTDAVQRTRDNAPGIKPSGGSYSTPPKQRK